MAAHMSSLANCPRFGAASPPHHAPTTRQHMPASPRQVSLPPFTFTTRSLRRLVWHFAAAGRERSLAACASPACRTDGAFRAQPPPVTGGGGSLPRRRRLRRYVPRRLVFALDRPPFHHAAVFHCHSAISARLGFS
jgi:hypothetical protein